MKKSLPKWSKWRDEYSIEIGSFEIIVHPYRYKKGKPINYQFSTQPDLGNDDIFSSVSEAKVIALKQVMQFFETQRQIAVKLYFKALSPLLEK